MHDLADIGARPSAAPRAALCALLAVSGACALTYEVVWLRLLALHAGSEPATLAALLAGFLGGLGLGGWIVAGPAERSARPLRLVAGIEAAAALFGALSARAYPAAIALFDSLAGPLHADLAEGPGVRILCAGLVFLPAAAMGATLPAAARAAVGSSASAGSGAAWLYGWNTLGGGAGAALCGFALLPRLGIGGTLALAAAAQIGVALAAGAMARRQPPRPRPAPGAAERAEALPPDILLASSLAGAAALASEVAWTQLFQASFGSTTYALSIVLTAYLAGIGIGSLLPAPTLDRHARPALLLALLQAWAAAALLLIVPLLGRLPLWVGPLSARWAAAPRLLYAWEGMLAAAVLLPLTALLGASFPVACRAAGSGRQVARAIGAVGAANLGGALAGIAAGRAAAESFGLRRTLLLAAAAHLAAAALLLARRWRQLPRRLAAGSAAALVLAGIAARPGWDPGLLTSGAYLHGPLFAAGAALAGAPLGRQPRALGRLRFYRESSAGIVSVREGWDGTLSLALNGRTEASSGADRAAQIWIGHLPALLRPQARSALLVGLASGFTLAALARHPLERIDCIELLPAVAEASAEFDALTGAPLRDPRVRLRLADARRWLARHPGPYDLIVSQPSNPWVAGVGALFTREFFERVRSRLSPDGLAAVWVQAYATDPDDFRAVLATFREVFPSSTLWEEALAGGDYFLLGSAGPEEADWARVAGALARPGARADLEPLGVRGLGDLLAHQVAGPRRLQHLARGADPITDDDLRLEFSAPLNWTRESVPEVVRLIERAAGPRRELDLSSLADAEERRVRSRLEEHDRLRERDRHVLDLLAAEEGDLAREPRLHLATTLLTSGWRSAASRELETLVAESPRLGFAWLLLGAARLSEPGPGAPARAAEALARAVDLRPGDATAWNLLGRALVLSGEAASARAPFDRALALRPDFPEALSNRAALDLASGRLDPALADLERAVALDPSNAALRVNLGLALRLLDRAADSRRVYEEGLALDPGHADLHYNLGTLELAEGHPERALEHYRRAAETAGSDALTERGLGLALLGLGRRSEARAHLESSLRLDPTQRDVGRLLRSLARGTEGKR